MQGSKPKDSAMERSTPGQARALEAIGGDDRLSTILCAIVDSYIETVEPVGSRTLSRQLDLGISPATIRNAMADLTDMGFLEQPHTSAGRVPTNLAYRFFVDARGAGAALPDQLKSEIERVIAEQHLGLDNLLSGTTNLLARLTRFTGIVATPRINHTRLRRIDFIRLEGHQVYTVLITQSNMVLHKIIEVSDDLSQDFLDSVKNYLNNQFGTRSLEDIQANLLESLVRGKESYDKLLAHAVRLSKKALDLNEERNLYVDGQANVVRGFADLEKVQRLLDMLEEKLAIIELLDETRREEGVRVRIGEENAAGNLYDCSLVTATYGNGVNALGAIGVIGPTRMDYLRIMPIIEYTAQVLSEAIQRQ